MAKRAKKSGPPFMMESIPGDPKLTAAMRELAKMAQEGVEVNIKCEGVGDMVITKPKPPKVRKVVIKNGQIKFIYDDKLAPLLGEGKSKVERASHVEPRMVDGKLEWTSDMSPVQPGVILGPFSTRELALAAEVEWLNARLATI